MTIFGIIAAAFVPEIRELILNHWRIVFIIIGCIGLSGLYLRLVVRSGIKNELKEFQNRIDSLEKENQFNNQILRINHAIILKFMNDKVFISKEDISKAIYDFYSSSELLIPDWKLYGISDEIINDMKKIHHESELKKIEQKNNNTDNKKEKLY